MASRFAVLWSLLLLAAPACIPGPTTSPDACPAPDDGSAACVCDGGDADAEPDADQRDGDADDAGSDGDVDPDSPAHVVRLMTFNIRHGAESSLEAVAEAIRAESPDVVGLQEVDVEADRSGGVDQAHRLSQLTGMASLFRTAIDLGGGHYGLAVLSRLPILSSESIRLTSVGEQRILVIVELLGPGGAALPFAVTHLGLDPAERLGQADEIVERLAGVPDAVLVGDLNATPDADEVRALTAALSDPWPIAGVGDGATIPSGEPTRRIDYVLLGPGWPTPIEAHVPATIASDHRPVVVTVELPADLRP